MGTIGTSVNLSDLQKRQDPNGLVAMIYDVIGETNDIWRESKLLEGNLPTGHVTTQRTANPTVAARLLNAGVASSKSSTRQVVDTAAIIEGNSEIDEEVLALQPDKEAFRKSEDAAFSASFNETIADYLFYGDTSLYPEKFNGLHPRFNALSTVKGNAGTQIVSAGGAQSDNTSMWLLGWGDKSIHFIYPKGATGGLQIADHGLQRKLDGANNPFYAWCTNMKWKIGLALKNPNYVARVANIDISDLLSFDTQSDVSANLIAKAILAHAKIKDFAGITPAWYVNETVYAYLMLMLSSKTNVYITRQELQGKLPELFLNGVPVRKCEAILSNESVIS